jgi:serine/threonine-protein kinase
VADLTARLQSALGAEYEVGRTLGTGGFAVVFLVRDRNLKRDLAVKVLSPELVTSKTVLARFRREAETVAQLSHPNIVPLHFIGQQGDLLYLAMQCVDGGSLADRIAESGSMPVEVVRRAVTEVASALAHAHKRGVVHRDIKPQNVLVDGETGRCLVTDFGIARDVDSRSLTASGLVLGTPAYLAPEQVTGSPSDHRADIYSLGLMAYEMLAGRQPFEGTTPMSAMMKRLSGPPEPISALRDDVPRDLEDVLDGCLVVDPKHRFQSAADVARALTGETPRSGGQPTREVIARLRTRRRNRWIGAASVGLFALGATALLLQKRETPTPHSVIPAVDSGMVLIPAAEYSVGLDAGPSNARPAHRVHLDAFGLDRREASIADFREFSIATNAPTPWNGAVTDADVPVTGVQWAEAASYCAWKHPGVGRLPSEEEWEAAARGTAGRRYPWGDSAPSQHANTLSANRSGPVHAGNFPSGATPDGVQDLIGNVWEWTSSPYRGYPGATAFADSMQQFRVIRGGAFNTPDSIATASVRGYNRPAAPRDQLALTGFRCAMAARPTASSK